MRTGTPVASLRRSSSSFTQFEFASERRRRCLTYDLCLGDHLPFRPFLQRCAEASPLGAEVYRFGGSFGLRAAPPGRPITEKVTFTLCAVILYCCGRTRDAFAANI